MNRRVLLKFASLLPPSLFTASAFAKTSFGTALNLEDKISANALRVAKDLVSEIILACERGSTITLKSEMLSPNKLSTILLTLESGIPAKRLVKGDLTDEQADDLLKAARRLHGCGANLLLDGPSDSGDSDASMTYEGGKMGTVIQIDPYFEYLGITTASK